MQAIISITAGSGGAGGAAATPSGERVIFKKCIKNIFAQFINSLWIFGEMILTHIGYYMYFGF